MVIKKEKLRANLNFALIFFTLMTKMTKIFIKILEKIKLYVILII